MKGTEPSSNLQEVWEEALAVIRNRVSRQSFEAWFRPLSLGSIEENRIQVLLPNRFFKEWFEEHYLGHLRSTLEDLLFKKVEIRLVLPEKEALAGGLPHEEPGERRTTRRLREGGTQLNPRYTFDSFVVGTSNQFAHAACMAVADQLAKTYNPLFIYGGVGLGKTHLLHAIGHHARQRDPRLKLSYVSSEKFTNDLINAIRFDATVEFRNRYRSLDLLLIDDIQFIAGKERTQEEFFHTFNDLYDSSKQIVISSDRVPREIPTLEERLRSRFEWGLIADIQPPDLETKIAILRKKAEADGIVVPDDVALFIATNSKSNIRELEGSLIRVVAYASMSGRELTLDLAKDTLQDLLVVESPTITVESIQKLVANHYNLKVTELKSKNNSQQIAFPRQVAMYLCKRMTESSLPEIGRRFGGKHHSTVIHAIQKIEKKRSNEKEFDKLVDSFVQLLH